jgi:dihydroorotate dehydrogenase (NAD+) catalytic subunit
MAASGTIGLETRSLIKFSRLGAIIPKTVTYEAKTGNPAPRTCETTAGMLNSIGLENKGIRYFLDNELPLFVETGATVIVSVGGETIEEYVMAAEEMNDAAGVSGLELNISCPNVDKGGVQFGCRPRLAAEVTEAVKYATRFPLIVKLTPNVASIADVAKACESAGADALSLINTIPGMAIDVESGKAKIGRGFGGLSGPAIKPVALRMVYETARAVTIPVIGIGGIMEANDAVEFLMAGATAVQIGTANFIDPGSAERIIDGLSFFIKENGYDHIGQLKGKAVL